MPIPLKQGSSHLTGCEFKYLAFLEACRALKDTPEADISGAIKAFNLFQKTLQQFRSYISSLPPSETRLRTHYEKKFSAHSKEQALFKQKFSSLFHPAFQQCRELHPRYKEAVQALLDAPTLQKAACTLITQDILTGMKAYAATLSAYAKVEKLYNDMKQLLQQLPSSACADIIERTHASIKAHPITDEMTLADLFEMKHFLTHIVLLETHRNRVLLDQIAQAERSTTGDPKKEAVAISCYQHGNSDCKKDIIQDLHSQIQESLGFRKQFKTSLKHVEKLRSSFLKAAPYLSEAPYKSKLLDHAFLGITTTVDSIETPEDTSLLILTLDPSQKVLIKPPRISSLKVWSPKHYSTPFLQELTSQYPRYRSISKGAQSVYTAFIYAYLQDQGRINALIGLMKDWNAPKAESLDPALQVLVQLKEKPHLLDELLKNKKNIQCLLHYFRHLVAHEISYHPEKYPDYSANKTPQGKKQSLGTFKRIRTDTGPSTMKVRSKGERQYLDAAKHMRNGAGPTALKALSNKLSFSFRIANFDDESMKTYGTELMPATCFAFKQGKTLILS
jgi:hypothetical protein